VLSWALYLNDDWRAEEGGALRLYMQAQARAPFVEFPPRGGRLMVFLSQRFEHEVLPAKRERLSITGWFRRRTDS
jgi:SM-20-related protein